LIYFYWLFLFVAKQITGALELLPSAMFLAMMDPSPNKGTRNHILDPDMAGAKSSNNSSSSSIRRVDSSNSNSRKQHSSTPTPAEASTLLKPGSGYGTIETPNPV